MNDCILTSAGLDTYGYGQQRFDGKMHKSHRIAYAKYNNMSMDDIRGVVIRHKCDVRNCINPDHLESGTQTDNVRDRYERGRSASRTKNGRAKLSEDQVSMIRCMYTGAHGQLSALSRSFGVGTSQIFRIVRGQQW